jgi:hypothetical protein
MFRQQIPPVAKTKKSVARTGERAQYPGERLAQGLGGEAHIDVPSSPRHIERRRREIGNWREWD